MPTIIRRSRLRYLSAVFALCFLPATGLAPMLQAQQKRTSPADRKPAPVVNPAQIELLETSLRFEANGDSRKEVHARVKINNELGVRQFALLHFDYNRRYQQVEFPLVRIMHGHGGVSDVLPGAISDQPNPAIAGAASLEDMRRKTVRVLGLQPGDELEYRVVTTEKQGPLAPDICAEHTFDRTGVVTHETFELNLPAARKIRLHVSPAVSPVTTRASGEGKSARTGYRWHHNARVSGREEAPAGTADVVASSFGNWPALFERLGASYPPDQAIASEAAALTGKVSSNGEKLQVLYDFVATQLRTADLPFGAAAYRLRSASDVLASQIATPGEKCALLAAFINSLNSDTNSAAPNASAAAVLSVEDPAAELPRPSLVSQLLTVLREPAGDTWLDPAIEVAPYGMIPSELRGKTAAVLGAAGVAASFMKVTAALPFAATQDVHVDATVSADGSLHANVRYRMRGDSELLLRSAFHQAAKDKWKELAALLALSDGFRGDVSKATVSDPLDTHGPFQVAYEISQPKFVDWLRQPVRLRVLLPQAGLPDAPGPDGAKIELGTPLDVTLTSTLHIPEGTRARVPAGISVARDYAAFASKYSAEANAIQASRHLSFLLKDIPGSRLADYLAFLRAVQNDEAQEITLESDGSGKKEAAPARTSEAAPKN